METVLMILGIIILAGIVGIVGANFIERAHNHEDPKDW